MAKSNNKISRSSEFAEPCGWEQTCRAAGTTLNQPGSFPHFQFLYNTQAPSLLVEELEELAMSFQIDLFVYWLHLEMSFT